MLQSQTVENDTCFPFSYHPPPLCALLCKLSGVFVTAWCWRKQQHAELWIANVPWGGRPRFDILNKLQIRQAGRGSGAMLISLPHHSQIWGPCENGNWVSLDTFVARVLLVMEDWTIQHSGKARSTPAMLAQRVCQMGKEGDLEKKKSCNLMQYLCKTYLC